MQELDFYAGGLPGQDQIYLGIPDQLLHFPVRWIGHQFNIGIMPQFPGKSSGRVLSCHNDPM
jgi:hypothetical protein